MFQTTNPLIFHTRNPNSAVGEATVEDVPNLATSQSKLKARNDTVSLVIILIIALLGILLAMTFGFIIYDRVQKDEGLIDAAKGVTIEEPQIIPEGTPCKGCISYSELKRLADSQGIEAAERYVNNSISQATSAPAEQIIRDLGNLTQYSDPRDAREKAAQLEEKLRDLQKHIQLTRDVGSSNGDLKTRYQDKVRELGRLADELVQYFNNTIGIAERKEVLEKELSILQKQINDRTLDWNLAKERIENRIDTIKGLLKIELERAGVGSEAEIDALIAKRTAEADKLRDSALGCEQSIGSNRIKINAYITELEQLRESLGDIEHQIGLKNWITHVLNTMNKFEAVKRQLKLLQETQLKQGRENITDLISSLEQRERELTGLIVEAIEKNVITRDELDLISDTSKAEEIKGNNFDTISRASAINKAKVLRLYIKKEQDLLKAWSRQQLDTFELSQKEYNNITETINAYNQSIQNHTEELESFRIQKEEKELRIIRITELTRELEESVANCEKVVNDVQQLTKEEEAEILRLQNIKNKIREINSDLSDQKSELSSIDENYRNEIRDLEAKIRDIKSQLASLAESKTLDEAKLRDYVNSINNLIKRGPKNEDVEKGLGEYRDKVRETAESYNQVVQLHDQVKEYLKK